MLSEAVVSLIITLKCAIILQLQFTEIDPKSMKLFLSWIWVERTRTCTPGAINRCSESAVIESGEVFIPLVFDWNSEELVPDGKKQK